MGEEVRKKYDGFSSDELLRRAMVLREIANKEPPTERRRLERLALEHENYARFVRTFRRHQPAEPA